LSKGKSVKIYLVLLCVSLLLSTALFFPIPIIRHPISVASGSTMYPEHNIAVLRAHRNGVDVLEYIDREQLVEVLSRYSTFRVLWPTEWVFGAYQDEIVWQIALDCRTSGWVRLYLGRRSYRFHSLRSQVTHFIYNASGLMEELDSLIDN